MDDLSRLDDYHWRDDSKLLLRCNWFSAWDIGLKNLLSDDLLRTKSELILPLLHNLKNLRVEIDLQAYVIGEDNLVALVVVERYPSVVFASLY